MLRDTAVYCTAEKFGLDELKRLALRKQGLQSGIQVEVILRSARFAYENTPDTDSRLRAHYLALIIRSRKTFKRSGTMQMEMEIGGSKLFFDLFVAMCNHVDDIVDITYVTRQPFSVFPIMLDHLPKILPSRRARKASFKTKLIPRSNKCSPKTI